MVMMLMSVSVYPSLKYLIIVASSCSRELASVILDDNRSIVMTVVVGSSGNIVTTTVPSHLAVVMTLVLN